MPLLKYYLAIYPEYYFDSVCRKIFFDDNTMQMTCSYNLIGYLGKGISNNWGIIMLYILCTLNPRDLMYLISYIFRIIICLYLSAFPNNLQLFIRIFYAD